MAEDLRTPIGRLIVLNNDPVVGKIEFVPMCPACSATVGNALAADATATAEVEGRLQYGVVGKCENCGKEMFTPFAAIYAELRRIGVMK